MKSSTVVLGLWLSFSTMLFSETKISAVREGRQVVILVGDKEILRYQAEPGDLPRKDIKPAFTRGGYIQSIHTPAGRLITDDFPANHLHHHGVWSAWTKTEFQGRKPDFWNMGAETGTVEFVALDRVWEKGNAAGFEARKRFIDLTAKPPQVALLETWQISVSVEEDRYVIDYTSTQTCATDHLLKLPEYHYGGIGLRGNGGWDGAENFKLLSSSGLTDRKKVNASREKWCWVGGEVDGAICGVTINCHPQNFRFPQPIRAHPTEPFFSYAPQQLGEMEIKPGEKFISRYRFIIADGSPDADTAERWWKEYSKLTFP